jgi:hypothetical protein
MTTTYKSNITSFEIPYTRSIPYVLWKKVAGPPFHFKLLQRPFQRLTPIVLLLFFVILFEKEEKQRISLL